MLTLLRRFVGSRNSQLKHLATGRLQAKPSSVRTEDAIAAAPPSRLPSPSTSQSARSSCEAGCLQHNPHSSKDFMSIEHYCRADKYQEGFQTSFPVP
eukprot:m.679485 g.679485  ORF g.679485 m.679485 type:complete len:97 (-) comp58583_c0_seq5:2236-2526(-)